MLDEVQEEFFRKHIKQRVAIRKKAKELDNNRHQQFEKYVELQEVFRGETTLLRRDNAEMAKLMSAMSATYEKLAKNGDVEAAIFDANALLAKLRQEIARVEFANMTPPSGTAIQPIYDWFTGRLAIARSEDLPLVDGLKNKLKTQAPEGLNISTGVLTDYEKIYIAAKDQTKPLSGKSAEEVRAGLKTALDTFQKARKDVVARLKEFDQDPEAQRGLIQSASALKDLEVASKTTDGLISILEDWQNPTAAGLRNEYDAIRSRIDPSQDMSRLLGDMRALTRQAEKEQRLHNAAYNKAAEAHRQRITNAERAVAALPKSIPATQKQGLVDMLAQAKQMLATGQNIAALKPLAGLLDDIETEAKAFDNAEAINSGMDGRLKTITKQIADNSGKSAIRGVHFVALGKRLEEFKTDRATMNPAAADKALAELEAEVTSNLNDQTALKEFRAATLKRIELTKKELESLGAEYTKILRTTAQKGDEKNLKMRSSLEGDLELVKEWTNTKDSRVWEKPITDKLSTVWFEIVRLKAGISGASVEGGIGNEVVKLNTLAELMDGTREIEAGESEEAKANRDIRAEIEEFRLEIKNALKLWPAIKSYPDDVNALRENVSRAMKAAKSDDTSGATSLLRVARERLKTLQTRPKKLNTSTLGNINKQWAEGTVAFEGKVNDLVNAARAAAGDDTSVKKQVADLEAQLRKVVAKLDRTAFASAAAVLGSETSTEPERLRAREDALSKFRLFNDMLCNDPLIRLCVANKFSIGGMVDGPVRKLREIELEVLRGV